MRRWAPLLLAVLLACTRPEQVRYEEELRAAEPAARHAVQSERLRQLMRGLEGLVDDRLPRELDVQTERRRRAEAVASVAFALAESASEIPAVLADVELTRAQGDELRSLADELRRRSLDLGERAPNLSQAELRTRLEAIDQSCDACHRRFRVLPVAPPVQ